MTHYSKNIFFIRSHPNGFIATLAMFFLSASFFSLLADSSSNAGSSAGVIEREIEKEYEGKTFDHKTDFPQIEIDIPEERLDISATEKIFVKEIVIEGVEALSSSAMQALVSPFLNQELSLRQIYQVCAILEEAYVKAGFFLARVYPPAQEIEEGVLHLEVLEGQLGSIEVRGNSHYSSAFIESYFSSLQGRAIQYRALLRALILINENTDLKVGAVFKRGKEVGRADLILNVEDGRVLHLLVNTNNYGKNLTTNFRTGGRFDFGNILGYGDLLSITEVAGLPFNSLYFTSGKYRVPLTRNGAYLAGTYTFSQFAVQEEKELRLHGRTDIASLEGSYAWIRARGRSLDVALSFDYKQIANYSFQETESFDKLRVLNLKFMLDRQVSIRLKDSSSFQFRCGLPYFLGGMGPVSSMSSRLGAGGRFFAFNLDYDGLYQMGKRCFLRFHGSGQLSCNKLTVPEQVYLGGSDTIRGYPLAVSLGDSGYYANVEWLVPPPFFGLEDFRFFWSKQRWKDVLKLVCFLDQGAAFLYGQSSQFLCGVGTGLRLQGPLRFSLSYDVALPLTDRDLSKGAFSYLKIMWQVF